MTSYLKVKSKQQKLQHRRFQNPRIFLNYRVIQKTVLHKSEEKMYKKMKMTKQKDENLAHEQKQYGVYFCKKNLFPFMIYVADMAILMSNFDSFDHGQIS